MNKREQSINITLEYIAARLPGWAQTFQLKVEAKNK